jgi:hypothetical protein
MYDTHNNVVVDVEAVSTNNFEVELRTSTDIVTLDSCGITESVPDPLPPSENAMEGRLVDDPQTTQDVWQGVCVPGPWVPVDGVPVGDVASKGRRKRKRRRVSGY